MFRKKRIRDKKTCHASNKNLYPLSNVLATDWTCFQSNAALQARSMATLEHQFDLTVNTDWAGDPLLHLSVSRL